MIRTLSIAIVFAGLLCSARGAFAAEPEVSEIDFATLTFSRKVEDKFDADEHLTDKIRALDGKRVQIKGYLHPSVFKTHGIEQFILISYDARNSMNFGPSPPLGEVIWVKMQTDHSTNFTLKPVTVEGRFSISPVPGGVKGKPICVFQIDDARVQ